MIENNGMGKLVISLDAEIAWGRIDLANREIFYPLFENTQRVMKRLLDLFDKYDVPVTWAVVGRLVEPKSNFNKALSPIAEYYPGLSEIELYSDSVRNKDGNSFLSFPDLMDMIDRANAPHEIASHSYAHLPFTHMGNKKLAESDFQAGNTILASYGVRPISFIYPRNYVAYLDVLKEAGYKIFRSKDQTWFSSCPKLWKKVFRQIDYFFPFSPKVVDVIEKDGLLELPGSMAFKIQHFTFRKRVPFWVLTSKAMKGLKKSVNTGKIFHLWFHPFNFAYREEEHFLHFEKVLKYAAKLRLESKIEIVTMGSLATKYAEKKLNEER